jgi:hypothetical protein
LVVVGGGRWAVGGEKQAGVNTTSSIYSIFHMNEQEKTGIFNTKVQRNKGSKADLRRAL